MTTTNIEGKIEETIEVVDQGESREVDVYIRPSYEASRPPGMHHLFDGSKPYFAKLWVGDGFTYEPKDDAGNDGDAERAGVSNSYTGEIELAGVGAGASEAKELVFAIEVMWGWVELPGPPPVSVNVDGCKGAVVGVSSLSGFIASDFVLDGITGGIQQQQAMDQLMTEINDDIIPAVVLDVRMHLSSIAASQHASADTSTITIAGVDFTTHKLHEDILGVPH